MYRTMSLKIYVYFMFLWIKSNQAAPEYNKTGITFSWFIATQLNYTFASPILDFRNTSNINIGNILENGEEAWVGYFRMDMSFEYFGCLPINNTEPTMILSRQWNTPGICFTLCNNISKTVFGLNTNKCFCMNKNSSLNVRHTECNNGSHGNWVAGGGDMYVSLYRQIDNEETDDDSSGKCLAFNYKGETMWTNCSENGSNICINDGKPVTVNDSSGHWHLPWTGYVDRCFENNCTPISYRYLDNSSIFLENGTIEYWTNIIRSKAIFSYKGFIYDNKSKEYAYVRKEKTQNVLYFTDNHTMLKQALFEQNADAITAEQTTVEITVSTRTSATVSVSTQAEVSTKGLEDETSDISIPVGVFVAVIVLIIFMVTLATIVIVKRREVIVYLRTAKSSRTIKSTLIEESPYNEIGDFGVDIKTCTDLENDKLTNTSFVPDNKAKESGEDIEIIDISMNNEEIKNVYDILDTTRVPKYKADNTYDTTAQVAKILKDQNSTVGFKEELICDDDESTYNHIYLKSTRKIETDNVYGMQKSSEENSDIKTHQEKKDLEGT